MQHIATMAGRKALTSDMVTEAVEIWESLNVLGYNQKKTMVRFIVNNDCSTIDSFDESAEDLQREAEGSEQSTYYASSSIPADQGEVEVLQSESEESEQNTEKLMDEISVNRHADNDESNASRHLDNDKLTF